jgi:hypothetical protein
MPFLQIGAVSVFDIQTSGASERTRQDRRAATEGISTYSGALRRQGLPRKREWTFVSAPLAETDAAALLTAAYGSASLHCTGDALPAGGVDCLVTIDELSYVDDEGDALGFKRIAQITLRER